MESWEPSQHLLIDTGKPRKTCVEVADLCRAGTGYNIKQVGRNCHQSEGF